MEINEPSDFGILLIAQGKQRYLNMAVNLVKSLRINHGILKIALVTDIQLDQKQKSFFDRIVAVDPAHGKGFSQKMRMYTYSPFQKTLFIDVDCLIMRPIDFIIKGFEGKKLSVLGNFKYEGSYIGTTAEKLQQTFPSTKGFPVFNGGVYYFEKSAETKQIFDFAIDIFENRYLELGLHLFNGHPGDEPAMAIAMAQFHCIPVNDDAGLGMYTPVGMTGTFNMDVLRQYCFFVKNERKVNPAIMHFGGGYPEAFHYRREVAKINLYRKTGLPRSFCSFLINITWNSTYAVYVFGYRLAKFLLRKSTFKLRPALPAFKFE